LFLGDCCQFVEVKYFAKSGVFKLYREFYKTYELQPGTINGHSYYLSVNKLVTVYGKFLYYLDDNYIISYCGSHWEISLKSDQGKCRRVLFNPKSNQKCVSDVPENKWKYFAEGWNQWFDAESGLNVECVK
jgi:hypothetical protein